MFPDELARMVVRRLRTRAAKAGRILYRDVSGAAGDVRRIVEHFVTVDSRGLPTFPEADSSAPRFVGQSVSKSGKGRIYEFTPNQIRSAPILDSDKNVVGVHFPSKLRDNKAPWTFTRDGFEKARNQYTQALLMPKTPTWRKVLERILPLPGTPKWTFGRAWPAPWPNENLIFPRAHAGPNGYDIQIKKKVVGKFSRWVRVQVDGNTYGRILAANKHFNEAYDNIKQKNHGKPVVAHVVQMSCSPARGTAARESFESLNSAGIGTFDVYAAKGLQITKPTEVIGFQVIQNGDMIADNAVVVKSGIVGTPKPWAVYKASENSQT